MTKRAQSRNNRSMKWRKSTFLKNILTWVVFWGKHVKLPSKTATYQFFCNLSCQLGTRLFSACCLGTKMNLQKTSSKKKVTYLTALQSVGWKKKANTSYLEVCNASEQLPKSMGPFKSIKLSCLIKLVHIKNKL